MTAPQPGGDDDSTVDAALPELPDTSGAEWIELTRRPNLWEYIRAVWARRRLAVEIARSKLKGEHVDSSLGELWFLLNPLLSVLIYWLVFGVILDTTGDVANRAGFIVVGVFTFDLCRTSMLRSSRAMTSNRGLMASLHFPRALLPVAVILEQAYNFVPQLIAMFGLLLVTGEQFIWTWVLVVPVLLAQLAFLFGAGLIVARLGHHTEDLSNALPFVLRLTFYLSGIIFSVERIARSDGAQALAAKVGLTSDIIVDWLIVNPFYSLITLMRHFTMSSYSSPYPLSHLWLSMGVWSVILLLGGMAYFRGAELDYASD